MADDKTKRGSPDNKRLNKSEPYEVAYAKSKRAKAAAQDGKQSGRSRRARPDRSAHERARAAATRLAGAQASPRGPSRRRRR